MQKWGVKAIILQYRCVFLFLFLRMFFFFSKTTNSGDSYDFV